MSKRFKHDIQILGHCAAPTGVALRPWISADFATIQLLSSAEGWTTLVNRPADSLLSWQAAWPTIIAEADGQIAGFLRALSDGVVTTYIAELLVAPAWRGNGLGRALLDACHALVPGTRFYLLAMPEALDFYMYTGFRAFPGFRRVMSME